MRIDTIRDIYVRIHLHTLYLAFLTALPYFFVPADKASNNSISEGSVFTSTMVLAPNPSLDSCLVVTFTFFVRFHPSNQFETLEVLRDVLFDVITFGTKNRYIDPGLFGLFSAHYSVSVSTRAACR